MKSIFVFALLIFNVQVLSASEINYQLSAGKWHLLGSSVEVDDLNNSFDSNSIVWAYDNGWKGYSKNQELMQKIQSPLTKINPSQGFWVASNINQELKLKDKGEIYNSYKVSTTKSEKTEQIDPFYSEDPAKLYRLEDQGNQYDIYEFSGNQLLFTVSLPTCNPEECKFITPWYPKLKTYDDFIVISNSREVRVYSISKGYEEVFYLDITKNNDLQANIDFVVVDDKLFLFSDNENEDLMIFDTKNSFTLLKTISASEILKPYLVSLDSSLETNNGIEIKNMNLKNDFIVFTYYNLWVGLDPKTYEFFTLTETTLMNLDRYDYDFEIQKREFSKKDDVVHDITNGLIWQNAQHQVAQNRQEAKQMCEDLTLHGFDNWVLPTQEDIEVLAEDNYRTNKDEKFLNKAFSNDSTFFIDGSTQYGDLVTSMNDKNYLVGTTYATDILVRCVRKENNFKDGWNLVSFSKDTNLNNLQCKNSIMKFAWTLKDNGWNLYSNEIENTYEKTFETIESNRGVWILCQ